MSVREEYPFYDLLPKYCWGNKLTNLFNSQLCVTPHIELQRLSAQNRNIEQHSLCVVNSVLFWEPCYYSKMNSILTCSSLTRRGAVSGSQLTHSGQLPAHPSSGLRSDPRQQTGPVKAGQAPGLAPGE